MLIDRQRFASVGHSICISAIVFVLTCISTWFLMRCEGHSSLFPRQRVSWITVRVSANSVNDFRFKYSRLPVTLGEIPLDLWYQAGIRDERLLDAWGRDVQYRQVTENSFDIFSYGRDGEEGGIGLDAYLHYDHREGAAACVPISQFLLAENRTEVRRGRVISAAATVSVIVLLFSLFLFNSLTLHCKPSPNRGRCSSARALVMKYLVMILPYVAIGTCFALATMSGGPPD